MKQEELNELLKKLIEKFEGIEKQLKLNQHSLDRIANVLDSLNN